MSRGSHSSRHSSISGKAREKAKVAELKAKVALLQRKQAHENETEKLRLQEELAIAQARKKDFTQIDLQLKRKATTDGMNEYLENVGTVQEENLPKELSNCESNPRFASTDIHQPTPKLACHSKRAGQIPVRLSQISPSRSSDITSPPRLPVGELILNY